MSSSSCPTRWRARVVVSRRRASFRRRLRRRLPFSMPSWPVKRCRCSNPRTADVVGGLSEAGRPSYFKVQDERVCAVGNLLMVAVLLLLHGFAYQQGFSRSLSLATEAGKEGRRLHSRPRYHGTLVALRVLVPALFVLGLWALLEPGVMRALVVNMLPPEVAGLQGRQPDNAIERIRSIASGYGEVGRA